MVYQARITVTTRGEGSIVDLTREVRSFLAGTGVREGLVNIFVTGSTAAVTTIEYEEGVLEDLARTLSRIAPDDAQYSHDRAWGDGNGRSHVKSAVVGPSLTVPISGGELATGTWQQIVLLELDVRSTRTRTVVLTAMG